MASDKKNILFVTPPYHCGVVEVAGSWPPLGLLYLGAQARKAGWNAEVYDAMTLRHDFIEIERQLRGREYDVFATTAITPTFPDAYELCNLAKRIRPECTTLIGGVHPTFCYSDILSEDNRAVDYIVSGEGELPLFHFLTSFEDIDIRHTSPNLIFRNGGTICSNHGLPLHADLDSLETAWDLLDWRKYVYHVIDNSVLGAVSTSRGCNHNCTFCSQQKFWNQTWRSRRPENVVTELSHLNKTYGINVFLFTDEYPTKDRDRWEEILDRIIMSDLDIHILIETRVEDIVRDEDILHKYRQAGVIHVYVGAEATDQMTLDKLNKEITVSQSRQAIELIGKHGMISETSFVLGFPEETRDSIEATYRLAKQFNPDFAHFLAITPWPYADFYDEVKDRIVVTDLRKYNLIEPIIEPHALSLHDIDLAIIDCYRRFYAAKMVDFVKCSDPFRRKYLLTSAKLIMASSFLAGKFAKVGLNPKAIMNRMLGR
jgi:anaerobic magnesium-protoporphyrin IX monomethyl ester cyclase